MNARRKFPRFTFGKYNGKRIDEVRFKDPQYVEWLCAKDEAFRQLVLSIPETRRNRARMPVDASKRGGLVKARLDPDHATSEGWRSHRPCLAIDAYKRRLKDDPCLPHLLPDEMHIDPEFDPDEANSMSGVPSFPNLKTSSPNLIS